MATISTEGVSYGSAAISGDSLHLFSPTNGEASLLSVPLSTISQCVVTGNKRDDLEIQFNDSVTSGDQDGLVQMTLHFPAAVDDSDDDEDESGNKTKDAKPSTLAERMQSQIRDSGALSSATGDIVVEFSKDKGNFVTPRGKYTIQLTYTYMHMQGPQYSHRVPYDDIAEFFLLPKADGARMAFVISLHKPIRQGAQKYSNLVLETHMVEETITLLPSEEELSEKYGDQLNKQMTMPLANLFGKIFKVLSEKKVFVPKQFLSHTQQHSLRCSIKANEGLLYPLAKSFIFINKPTVIIKFEDIEAASFERYEGNGNNATKNFDLAVALKDSVVRSGEPKEYKFTSISRVEYNSLYDYLESKEVRIATPKFNAAAGGAFDLGDEEEDDDDYDGESNSASEGSDEEDEDDATDAGSEDEAPRKKKRAQN